MIYEEIQENQKVICIKRTDDDGKVWWIPPNLANSDYQQYLAQLEAEK
jgi:hypothetical protein